MRMKVPRVRAMFLSGGLPIALIFPRGGSRTLVPATGRGWVPGRFRETHSWMIYRCRFGWSDHLLHDDFHLFFLMMFLLLNNYTSLSIIFCFVFCFVFCFTVFNSHLKSSDKMRHTILKSGTAPLEPWNPCRRRRWPWIFFHGFFIEIGGFEMIWMGAMDEIWWNRLKPLVVWSRWVWLT